MFITLLYSCDGCGVKRIELVVPARGDDEDLLHWMDQVIARVSQDHLARSPQCGAQEMSELLIPMTGATRIGGPSTH